MLDWSFRDKVGGTTGMKLRKVEEFVILLKLSKSLVLVWEEFGKLNVL